ncbi:bactericidal permeability-increasing protein [Dunckerocampus dactyliophorus]|uniref:bactericidal permeability-increasing protein n=1 Tax=Dunckerocampus dactyliophorus TaxID=161453 RepID=UPI0024075505|nr:bactericidal permeability-increasing protein [Dunckerocampus dactyliophorus]
MLLLSMITALIFCTYGEKNPAVQVVLTNKGLQYGRNVAADWIQEKLEVVTLPDVDGEIPIGFLGHIGYTLTGVTIPKCDFPDPSLEFYQDVSGLKMSIAGLSIALTGAWRAHCGIIYGGGSFDLALFGVDLVSVVHLGSDGDGHLSLINVSCDTQTRDVDLRFYGGSSWILQPFVKHLKARIISQTEAKLCAAVEELIVNLDHHLQAMKVIFQVNQDLILDLPLTGLPVIDASSIRLGFQGEFYSIKSPKEPPFEAQPFVVPEHPGYMLSVGLSDFTLNSASFGYFSAGLLQAFIDDSMIPPSSPVHLNTRSLGPFIPQLPKMFPDLPMVLHTYARHFPVFSFHPGAITLSLPSSVKAFAIQPNATLTPLFKLHVDSSFQGRVWTDDGCVKGSVTMDSITLTLAATVIGPFKTTALENLAKMAMKMFVLPRLNDKLSTGFALPRTRHAQLVNSVLTVEEGFIAFCSDAKLQPSDHHLNEHTF